MRILLVGSGAREHALAWKMKASPLAGTIYTAPGNAGTAALGTNVPIEASDIEGLVAFALEKSVDLVVVGPELPLSLGLVDALASKGDDRGPLCFGPSAAAARIESSKVFSKSFMKKYGIPTADFAVFSSFKKAKSFIEKAPWPYVIKASGLASGKGVFIPDNQEEALSVLSRLLMDGRLGAAGSEVLIEERLSGEEVSLLGFCDGKTVRPMPLCQDHKRLLEGEMGPNTGGLGAIASALPEQLAKARELSTAFLEKASAGLEAEGSSFVGVLYAGLIMTAQGPKVLEYNCRFGDPETQVLLPLLESDLVPILVACAAGGLDGLEIGWKKAASACVVLASEGYTIADDEYERDFFDFGGPADTILFHGATKLADGLPKASGGRLLCASAWGKGIDEAVDLAYSRLSRLEISHARYRRDIGAGRKFLRPASGAEAGAAVGVGAASVVVPSQDLSAALYASAGVDIDAGDKAVELMSTYVRSTYGPEVLAGIGSFGGVYDAKALGKMRNPVLVSSTDGVGTKVKLAALSGRYEGIGRDIVNHCVDDILVQGARPLFFLDYVATSRLDPAMAAHAVSGMAESCREAGCALIGGETAEMPGVYLPGEFDLAGAIVGVAERDELLPRADLFVGDLLIGLPSSGLHTNGYSLARRIFGESGLDRYGEILGRPLIDALLEPHRSYLGALKPLLEAEPGLVKALAHITGGGFEGNIPRVLPEVLDALVDANSWPMPPLFHLIMEKGGVAPAEMYRVFNMGIGMVVILSPGNLKRFTSLLASEFFVIGRLTAGKGRAILDLGRVRP
ncbi:MAG: phosphoribosylamine--glycine ligase [Spirochaetes bacterium]|nr:phosphoribosylamine--glycine ligase [Spirochaetota bacterium]